MKILIGFLVFFLVVGIIVEAWPLAVMAGIIFIAWKVYETIYFRSEQFLSIKKRIESYIADCNALNEHIEDLKETQLRTNRVDYGSAAYHDNSKWNYKRSELANQKYAPNVYNCSRTVCDGARKEPFKYICKYFGIKADETTLAEFETILNNFEAAEDGKVALKQEKDNILTSIQGDIPVLIRKFSKKKLEKELGFEETDFTTVYFPRYVFKYISSGGNASTQCDVILDIDNLNRFIEYLSSRIRFSKSVAGQRALMTSKLRQSIKERDNYTCMQCGASVEQEPHLLLEIDHIIPVSKGGLTTESNLQTLCWRCNRTKGSRIP